MDIFSFSFILLIITLSFVSIVGYKMCILLIKYARHNSINGQITKKSPMHIAITAIMAFMTILNAIFGLLNIVYSKPSNQENIKSFAMFITYLGLTAYCYNFRWSLTKWWVKAPKVFIIFLLIMSFNCCVIEIDDTEFILIWLIIFIATYNIMNWQINHNKLKNDNLIKDSSIEENLNSKSSEKQTNHYENNNKNNYCPYCGKPINNSINICSECGNKIKP